MKKLSPLANDYHTEKRVIGNDNVGDGICRWRGRTRVESMASSNFVNFIKVFFRSALASSAG
ncbi:MAG TPA: hypothetical protein VGK77_13175 [Candidatus Binatia bacterium]|jgi:hypothetical protein